MRSDRPHRPPLDGPVMRAFVFSALKNPPWRRLFEWEGLNMGSSRQHGLIKRLGSVLGFIAFFTLPPIFAPQSVAAALRNVPADYNTIQAAIDAAQVGDTVLVAPGTYLENIDFHGKAITVTSAAGPEVTVIDGNRAGSVVTFATGEGPGAVLNGFTIRNGRAGFDAPGYWTGGGILVTVASPTITNNIITDNQAVTGCGIGINSGSPTIQGNVIVRNTQAGGSGGGGGGISLYGSAAQILENVIADNSVGSGFGGGIFGNSTAALIRGNRIQRNVSSGISPCYLNGAIVLINQSDTAIIANLITDNLGDCGAGIYLSVPSGDRGPRLLNNTIAANSGAPGSEIFATGFADQVAVLNNIIIAAPGQTAVYCEGLWSTTPPTFQFNDVYSATGAAFGGVCGNPIGANGNVSVDPLFVDASRGNYHLRPDSPCIDAGTNLPPDLPATDLDQETRVLDGTDSGTPVVDIGADEFNPAAPSLTVTTTGNGIGTITSTPAGITCGSVCNAAFAPGASVTLTPIALPGFIFTGWGGGCSGMGECTVTVSSAMTVTATFHLAQYQLSVTTGGAGSGTVTSAPTGIDCGATCTGSFAYNTAVTLTASPATGSAFTGWSGGGCSGTGTCQVTMSAAQSVTASFTRGPLALTSLTANLTAPQLIGTAITFTVTASGGVAPYQYKWMVSDGTTWTMQGWGSSNSFTWTPAVATPNARVGVWIRSAGSTQDSPETGGSIPFAVSAPEGDSGAVVIIITSPPHP
jgi:hypothetical protein